MIEFQHCQVQFSLPDQITNNPHSYQILLHSIPSSLTTFLTDLKRENKDHLKYILLSPFSSPLLNFMFHMPFCKYIIVNTLQRKIWK